MSAKVSQGIAPLPPKARQIEIPYSVLWCLLGARVLKNYRGSDSIGLELDGEVRAMHEEDYAVVVDIAKRVERELGTRIVTPKQWSLAYVSAQKKLENVTALYDKRQAKRGIVMLKDNSGAGYWRMVLPAKYMEGNDFWIDVTSSEVKFEYLLEYETVFVQRIHDWNSFYVLEKLKAAGRRIVYDLDDDLFNITPDNPAFHVIGRDQQMAAAACLRLADCVTTTTGELQKRLAQVMNGTQPLVIPNALDPDDGWTPTDQTGSPDGHVRLFWQGSATHEEDWMECIEAVDVVMHDYPNMRLVVLGCLPRVVQERLGKSYWKGKVEYMGFTATETYFELVKHVRAEVGLAPLRQTVFNAAKSPIKFVECSVVGMPTVASNVLPYSGVIEDGEDGWLCSTTDDWIRAIKWCLAKSEWRREMVAKARSKVSQCFDIRKTAETWKKVLLP